MTTIYPLAMKPGIQKDGTPFATRCWTEGQWMRFRRGLPQKIGGYNAISSIVPFEGLGVPRGTIIIPSGLLFYIYYGTFFGLYYTKIIYRDYDNKYEILEEHIAVTPDDYVIDVAFNVLWTFEVLYSTVSKDLTIIAHPGKNRDITNSAEAVVYYGKLGEKLKSTNQSVSGGMVVISPRLILLDNNGTIKISEENNPAKFPDSDNSIITRITSQKLLAGREMRGTSGGAALIWSADTLLKLTFVGGATLYNAYKIGKTSLLSVNTIAELDNIFFWAGTDRFMYYNGVINTLENDQNIDFFYKRINKQYAHKAWMTVNPEFNEIWCFFPLDDASECNHAIIFNKKEGNWYNTDIERSCGYYHSMIGKPIWFYRKNPRLPHPTPNPIRLYLHETGKNNVYKNQDKKTITEPINIYIESSSISWCAIDAASQWKGLEKQVILNRFEPDFIQNGTIIMTIKTKSSANSQEIEYGPFNITSETSNIDINKQGREITLKFSNNEIDGYFEFGNCLLSILFGDERR